MKVDTRHRFKITHIIQNVVRMTILTDTEKDRDIQVDFLENTETEGFIKVEEIIEGEYLTKLVINQQHKKHNL